MKTIFLLILIALSTLSSAQSTRRKTSSLTPPKLPPHFLQLDPPKYIFSGFGSSYIVDVQANMANPILEELETKCASFVDETPFFPRLFIVSLNEAIFYCANLNQIYKLDPQNNFSTVINTINLTNTPTFNETQFYLKPGQNNSLLMLGLIDNINTYNSSAHNFTTSHLLQIDLSSDQLTSISTLQGYHNEPIMNLKVMSNGEVVAVGEKLYDNQQKLNTYYLGDLTVQNFDRVVDFYISDSYGFIPHVSLSSDEQYIFYSNEGAVFKYNKNTGDILEYSTATTVSNQFETVGQVKWSWEEVPFIVSQTTNVVYVYTNGVFTQINQKTMQKTGSVSLPTQIPANAEVQFFFFENGNVEETLMQYDNTTLYFLLNKQEVKRKAFRETDTYFEF